jgi:hypothetical protein
MVRYRVTFTFNFMESESSLPCLQELATEPHLEKDQSTARRQTIFDLRFALISAVYHLRRGLPICFSPHSFGLKFWSFFQFFPTLFT